MEPGGNNVLEMAGMHWSGFNAGCVLASTRARHTIFDTDSPHAANPLTHINRHAGTTGNPNLDTVTHPATNCGHTGFCGNADSNSGFGANLDRNRRDPGRLTDHPN